MVGGKFIVPRWLVTIPGIFPFLPEKWGPVTPFNLHVNVVTVDVTSTFVTYRWDEVVFLNNKSSVPSPTELLTILS